MGRLGPLVMIFVAGIACGRIHFDVDVAVDGSTDAPPNGVCTASDPDAIECNGQVCTSGRCCLVSGQMCVTPASCNGNGMTPLAFFDCDGPEDCPGDLCCKLGNEARCASSCPDTDVICDPACACPGGLTCGPLAGTPISICS